MKDQVLLLTLNLLYLRVIQEQLVLQVRKAHKVILVQQVLQLPLRYILL